MSLSISLSLSVFLSLSLYTHTLLYMYTCILLLGFLLLVLSLARSLSQSLGGGVEYLVTSYKFRAMMKLHIEPIGGEYTCELINHS